MARPAGSSGRAPPSGAGVGHRSPMVAARLPGMADSTTRRAPRPDDLYAFRIPTDPRLSPDGGRVVFTLQTVAPSKDGYRRALWTVPTDGSEPARRLTIGAKQDGHPRFSPDGRSLAFLSDRRLGRRGAARRSRRSRGRQPGPSAAARRPGRGSPPHRPAARRRRLRMGARRTPAGGPERVARSDPGGRRSPPGPSLRQARARRATAVRLPLPRPAPGDDERCRVHLRADRQALDRRRGDRRGAPARGPAGRHLGDRLVARRVADRLRREPGRGP